MSLYNGDVYISIVITNISLACPSYSHFGQTNDQPPGRLNGIFFFRPIQREEISFLIPAACYVFILFYGVKYANMYQPGGLKGD